MEIKETKKRSMIKAITWRIAAIINSWAILSFFVNGSNLYKALLMNLTGFFVFYGFERVWSKIKYGRFVVKEKNSVNEC
jgi:hypothetical protein